ncbi:MAG TPA: ATP-binding cassette domain-containing protein, partial [Conexibacter sp.]|nr:ATP-binding cassette domain-containing protein [Conexibacter sp.]
MLHTLESDDRRVPERAPAGEALATLTGITKRFYGKAAIEDVAFDVRAGEVHALLGENGAGKSTLCSVLAGLYRPESGEVVVGGEARSFHSPHDALSAGVGMVYQHYRLVSELTVAENLALGHPEVGFRLSRRALEARAQQVMERYGMNVPVSAYVGELSVGEQQRVEILKLLAREVQVLILDEPTAVLTPQESEVLFTAIRAMAAEGKAIVFISHKLGEVLTICDRVTVLRRGALVGSIDAADADRHALARMMVGEEAAPEVEGEGLASAEAIQRAPLPADAARVLSVNGLRVLDDRGQEAVAGVDLHVKAGELLGVAGVAGNGQRELAEAIAGVRS